MIFKVKKPIILASASPRRREILESIGLSFEVIPSDEDEDIKEKEPGEMVLKLCRLKAESVAKHHPQKLVIGSDTIVVLDGEIMGKPRDREDAIGMLSRLSGRVHKVYSGVSFTSDGITKSFYETTFVEMHENPLQLIKNYVDTGAPMDKAGSYGIQDMGSVLIKEIRGDYYNVLGLPVGRLMRELMSAGEVSIKGE